VLPEKIVQLLGEDLSGITIGIWGLSFKPGTDDMREASSLVLIEELIARNASIQAYDPVAMPAARHMFPEEWFKSGKLKFTEHQYDALQQADALVLVTEWKPFCYPDLTAMKKLMRRRLVLDGRNQYDPKHMLDAGFEYFGIGRGVPEAVEVFLSLAEMESGY
jgi:UDPglucose 6-dehydrogenase